MGSYRSGLRYNRRLILDFEYFNEFLVQFQGWIDIPTMAVCGLMTGLVIHFIGDPGEIHLIVNNIRFNKGKLDPKIILL